MKSRLLHVLVILMLLSFISILSCQKTEDIHTTVTTAEPVTPQPYEPWRTYHEVYDPETDFDNRFGRSFPSLVETEDAYYVIYSGHTDENGFSSGNYIYYADRENGEYGLLCSKPECTHKTSSCNARIMGRMGTLSRFGDRLFYIVDGDAKGRPTGISSANCYSIALDGTERRLEFEMLCEWENTPQFFYCHRGNFYGCSLANTVVDGKIGYYLSVTEWDPETGDHKVIFSRDECSPSYYPRLFFFGRYVYFCFDDRTGFEEYVGKKTTLEVWRWDMEGEELEPVYIAEPGTCSGAIFSLWVESEDRVYIVPNLPDPDSPIAVYLISGGELSEAYRFDGDCNYVNILDGLFFRQYDYNSEDRSFSIELIDFNGKPFYRGRLDMSFIGEAVPGAVFCSCSAYFGGMDALYCVFAAEAEDGTEFEYVVRYDFGKLGEEPVRTMICADASR